MATHSTQQASLTCVPAPSSGQQEQVWNTSCGPHQMLSTQNLQTPAVQSSARQAPSWPQSPFGLFFSVGDATKVQSYPNSLPRQTEGPAALSPKRHRQLESPAFSSRSSALGVCFLHFRSQFLSPALHRCPPGREGCLKTGSMWHVQFECLCAA